MHVTVRIEVGVNEYTILEKLGEGGMGQVFRAHHNRLGRDVALKMITAESAGDNRIQSRFRREIKLMCALSHPHIVPVYDGGVLAGRPYFAMQLVEGDNLHDFLERHGAQAVERVLGWLVQLADALAYLHGERLMHRDIKPRNLILTQRSDLDHIVLVDFGLARTTTSAALTRPGEIVGTISFLAPEVLESEQAGFPLDVWAFGVTACRLLTGSPLFQERSMTELLHDILGFDLKEPEIRRRFDARLERSPPPLRELLAACLARDPAARPSFRDIHHELASLRGMTVSRELARLEEETPSPPPRLPPRVAPRAPGARRGLLGLAGGAFLAAALSGLLMRSTDPGPGPLPASPSSPEASRPPEGGLPGNILALVSEKSALVDFTIPDVDRFLVILEGPGAPDGGWREPSEGGRRVFHHIFRGLSPSSLYSLHVETTDGRRLVSDFPLRTHWSRLAETRRKLAALQVPGAAELALSFIEKRDEPESISPLIAYLGSAYLEKKYLRRIASTAGVFRHPTLTRALLESARGVEDDPTRVEILRAVAASRLPDLDEEASAWLRTTRDEALAVAAARVVGLRGRREDFPLLLERSRTAPHPEILEAMIRCDPGTSRETFLTWLTPDSDRRQAAAWGLDRLGGPQDLEALASSLPGGDEAAVFLADRASPSARKVLLGALAKHPTPRLIFALARTGAPPDLSVTSSTNPDPGLDHAADLAGALDGAPVEARRVPLQQRLQGAAGADRDRATWLLGVWRDPALASLLDRRAADPVEDPHGLAFWARGRVEDPPGARTLADRAFEELARGPFQSGARAALVWLAAWALDPVRASGMPPRVASDATATDALEYLVGTLDPASPGTAGIRPVAMFTYGPYMRTGLELRRGESRLISTVRFRPVGWPGLAPLPAEDDPLVVRLGRRQLELSGFWRGFLADRAGELLLTARRGFFEREDRLTTIAPGVTILLVQAGSR